ncbi:MAG: aminotransferase class V-fold PLP-dependent enzyme [Cyclobacteriaceae bacterium]
MSNKIYLTPGPSQLFYTFEEHFKKGLFLDVTSMSHRSKDFVSILQHTVECVKELLEVPMGYDVFFLNSANEAWDRIIQNLVISSSHHFANGAFSKKFHDFSLQHRMESTLTQVEDGATFTDFAVPEKAELIGLTKNETSMGFTFPEVEIELLRKANPDKLMALDIVSATPSLPINLGNLDTAYFSVQKAFGMPPGLGVWICNEKCHEKAAKKSEVASLGSYRSLPNLKKLGDKNQTPETPNTMFIYLLGKIAEDMLKVGKQKIVNDTVYKSTILYQAIENHPKLSPFVTDASYQSKTTIVVNADSPQKFISYLKDKGLVIGSGYGAHKENHIRIANFPTHSKEVIEMLVDFLPEIE